MSPDEARSWEHSHAFGTGEPSFGESRTRWVTALTFVMMVVEIVAGVGYRSMALLADGWHMATHVVALGVAAFAYAYARRHAADPRFSFGTGKVGALGGFASAVGLALAAVLILGESVIRLGSPRAISFDQAIVVATVGLLVNLASAILLRSEHHHDEPGAAHRHHDHNLRGAYLHVVADALTSVLAIVALLAGKLLGTTWLDPAMGIVGSLVIARWSYGLLRDTSGVLLDAEVSAERRALLKAAVEVDGHARVVDLHLWRVGPEHLAALIAVVSPAPREPGHYKALLAPFGDLAHVTVEVHRGV
ncbi:MAG: CDF family Co(II)/Ni(II) efflux transporter DmeF [Planctomycetes bacterium]|nr:CDF family Co(II)/Ni(II) efflux transporter DmeF [Planctomycetota bacterium]